MPAKGPAMNLKDEQNMRISIREALFSGEEVDSWEPPKSNWMLIKPRGQTEWNKEFVTMPKPRKMKDIVSGGRKVYKPNANAELHNNSAFETKSASMWLSGNTAGHDYWYILRPNGEDFILFSNQTPELIEKAKQMLEDRDFEYGIYDI